MSTQNFVKPVAANGGKGRGMRNLMSSITKAGRAQAQPRPQRGGGGGSGVLRVIVLVAIVAIVFGNNTSTEITAQLISSAILWGAVGYAITWIAQYAFDASWEGDWGLFIARMTMPLIALVVFSTVGLSIATGAISRIATVTATAPPVQSASDLAGGLVRLLGGVTQSAATTAASWSGGSWGEYAGGVQVPTVGSQVNDLGIDLLNRSLVVPANSSVALPNLAPAPLPYPAMEAAPTSAVEAVTSTVVDVAKSAYENVTAERYVVQRGDTMYNIAKQVLGDGNRYPELCAANGLAGSACSELRAGQQVKIPSGAERSVTATSAQMWEAAAPANRVTGVHAAPLQTTNLVQPSDISDMAKLNARLGEQARAQATAEATTKALRSAETGDSSLQTSDPNRLNGNSENLMFGIGN